jgi:hypothetical protein
MKFEILGKKFLLIYKVNKTINNLDDKFLKQIKRKIIELVQRNSILNTSQKEPKVLFLVHQNNEYVNIYMELNINLVTNDKTLFTLNIEGINYELEEIYNYYNFNSINVYLQIGEEYISKILALILLISENVDVNSSKKEIEQAIIKYDPNLKDHKEKLKILVENSFYLIQDRKNQ